MKILIVDDDPSNLTLLETLLQNSGYEVGAAANGEIALSKLRSDNFDLIISDILMPVMDGYNLCLECKADERLKSIPFIFCSGTYTDDKDEQLALKFGAEAFIHKPFNNADLINKVKEVISASRSGKIKKDVLSADNEKGVYKLYSERLIDKLEKKMQDLDKEKMSLEMEVAERIKVEARLRKSRDFAESLFHAAPAVVVILDITGRIIRFNPYMEKISGYSEDEVKGREWSGVFSPEKESKDLSEIFSNNADNKAMFGNISSIVTKNGERREIVWFDSPLEDVEEKTIGLLAVGQDITEQLKLQKDLFKAKKKEVLESFAITTAKNFNQLLAKIHDTIDKVEGESDPSKKSEYLKEARKVIQKARDLNSRLLTMGKKSNA